MNSKLIIHLSKLDHNLDAIDRRLKPGVQRMAVIKDNAYGHGLTAVAKHICNRVEWFCVARAVEARTLRKEGITNPILVFEAPTQETALIFKEYDITATLNEHDIFDVLLDGTKYQINIDTGMHRLGVLPEEVQSIADAMKKYTKLECTGIYTHFYNSDDPGNAEVEKQLKTFKKARSYFPSELMTHTANSGGIFHYGHLDLQFDAVRPGVCLYGYGAGEVDVPDLEPILDWKSFLMQVKKVKKGEPVSYGARWRAPEDGFIGIIPTGYSDGIPRILTNKIKILIGDKLYDQVGTISMNYSIVYLKTDFIEKGEEVYFLKGKELTAKHWASLAGTIPYEITTSIKERVNKEYS